MKENNEIDTREVVIRVDNVKKSFKSYKDKATSFKERFVNYEGVRQPMAPPLSKDNNKAKDK